MKKFLLLSLMIISLLILSACSAEPAASPEETAAIRAAADVLIAEGRLLPKNVMEQSFSIPGQVAEVLVEDGDQVQAGQVLARLNDSPEARLALARAQQEALSAQQALDALQSAASVNLAQSKLEVIAAEERLEDAQEAHEDDPTDETQANLEAAEALLEQAQDEQEKLESGAGVNPDQFAAAEARLQSAEAAIVSAQAAIDALELKASMDGTLVDVTLQVGQRVTAGQPVLTVADFSKWVIKTDNLTEAKVVKVSLGQPVSVVLDALPGQTFIGEVTHINTRYEEKRGDITYTATIRLTQTDPQMRWGMTAAVTFTP